MRGREPLWRESAVAGCREWQCGIDEALIKAGADPNTATLRRNRLMTAARTGNADAVKVLTRHGANVNARENGRSRRL